MERTSSVSLYDQEAFSTPNRISFSLAVNYYSLSNNTIAVPVERGRRSGDGSNGISDFEFETGQHSREYEKREQEHEQQQGQHMPSMSFADELFCDGQVMPLKPPPRFQCVNDERFSKRRTTDSSLISPKSVLKGPLFRWTFRNNNENFDPFMTALEHVRKEKTGKDKGSPHRRTRSLSPLRATPLWYNPDDPIQNQNMAFSQPILHVGMNSGGQTEPKTLTSKRVVGNAKSRSNKPSKPTMTSLKGNTLESSESFSNNDTRKSKSLHNGSKRFSLKENIFRSKSEGSADIDSKQRAQSAGTKDRNNILRNSSFKSMHRNHYIEKKEEARDMRKKSYITYQAPCMLVCLGFGQKGLRNLN